MGRPPTATSPTGSFNLSRKSRLEYTQIEALIKNYLSAFTNVKDRNL
jgi:hypothetical protein